MIADRPRAQVFRGSLWWEIKRVEVFLASINSLISNDPAKVKNLLFISYLRNDLLLLGGGWVASHVAPRSYISILLWEFRKSRRILVFLPCFSCHCSSNLFILCPASDSIYLDDIRCINSFLNLSHHSPPIILGWPPELFFFANSIIDFKGNLTDFNCSVKWCRKCSLPADNCLQALATC